MVKIQSLLKSNVDRLPIIRAPINFQECGKNIAVLELGRRQVNYHTQTLTIANHSY